PDSRDTGQTDWANTFASKQFAGEWQRPKSVSTLESTLRAAPSPDVALPVDETGSELKRGAFFNTIALLASNFRGVFTFLVARLLGPAVLGTFAVAWAMTDLISKIGVFGLDDAITTFIARSQAEHADLVVMASSRPNRSEEHTSE